MTDNREIELLHRWLQTKPGGERSSGSEPMGGPFLGEPPAELDAELVYTVLALRPDLAPPPKLSLEDILDAVSEGPFAVSAAEAASVQGWLDGEDELPEGADPDVVEALLALRPDLAPAPRLDMDGLLDELSEGPFAQRGGQVIPFRMAGAVALDKATPKAEGAAAFDRSTPKAEVVDLSSRRRFPGWIMPALGVLAAAASVLLVVGPMHERSAPMSAQAPVQDMDAPPMAAGAPQKRADTGTRSVTEAQAETKAEAAPEREEQERANQAEEADDVAPPADFAAAPATDAPPPISQAPANGPSPAPSEVGLEAGSGGLGARKESPSADMKGAEEGGEDITLSGAVEKSPSREAAARSPVTTSTTTTVTTTTTRATSAPAPTAARPSAAAPAAPRDDHWANTGAAENSGVAMNNEEATNTGGATNTGAAYNTGGGANTGGAYNDDALDEADAESPEAEVERVLAKKPAKNKSSTAAAREPASAASSPSPPPPPATKATPPSGGADQNLQDLRRQANPPSRGPDLAARHPELKPLYDEINAATRAGDTSRVVGLCNTLRGNPDPDVGMDAAWRAARVTLAAGDTAQALAHISRGLELSGASFFRSRLLGLQGEVLEARGDVEGAKQSYKQATRAR